MGSLLSYSGITAKVRAMSARLFSKENYKELSSLSTVADALAYLKGHGAYSRLFSNMEESLCHRGDIEKSLHLSKYRDFTKLYRFAGPRQRSFLKLYFYHYEIILLEYCLRTVFDHRKFELDLSSFKPFLEHHSKLDLDLLASSQTINELVENLKGTEFYDVLKNFGELSDPVLKDYEYALDLYYFRTIWNKKEKELTKEDSEFIERTYGSRMDLLNIQWIYRSKKYYRLEPDQVYAQLIPISYKLKKGQIRQLIEAPGLPEMQSVLNQTYYSRTYRKMSLSLEHLEEFTYRYLYDLHKKDSVRNPYSIAVLNTYLYQREEEVRKIITVIEGIRYGLTSKEILNYLMIE